MVTEPDALADDIFERAETSFGQIARGLSGLAEVGALAKAHSNSPDEEEESEAELY